MTSLIVMPKLGHLRGATIWAAVCVFLVCAVTVLQAQTPVAPLTITSGPTLPKAIAGSQYSFQLRTQGGVTPITWGIDGGKLPPGLSLDRATGMISGVPRATGQFRFEVNATDSSSPPVAVKRAVSLAVVSAFAIKWQRPPAVSQDGIEGSLAITNQTADEVDLTLIVVAVNEVGKAFALGYQHFTMAAGASQPGIPFGSSLPRGTYVVHVDAVGEVPENYVIYRSRLQSGALPVQ
jgi:hypothetical protein